MHQLNLRLMVRSKLSCNHCLDQFENKNSLIEHLDNVHNVKTKKSFKCDICNRNFLSYHLIRQHILSVHNLSKYKSDQCDESFHCLQKLGSHNSYKQFKCNFCEKRFAQTEELRTHYINTHSNKYKCELCDEFYSNINELTFHIEMKHLSQDKSVTCFPCELCSYQFYEYPKLLKHLQTSHNIKALFEYAEKM